MVLTRPVTKTTISTTTFGQPVYDILKNLSTPVWTNVTMSTGFEQFGGSYKTLAYLEVGRMVILQGMIKTLNDLPGVATICATIPVAIAPPATILTSAYGGAAAGEFIAIRADLESAGNIKVRSFGTKPVIAGQYISFDSIWVRA